MTLAVHAPGPLLSQPFAGPQDPGPPPALSTQHLPPLPPQPSILIAKLPPPIRAPTPSDEVWDEDVLERYLNGEQGLEAATRHAPGTVERKIADCVLFRTRYCNSWFTTSPCRCGHVEVYSDPFGGLHQEWVSRCKYAHSDAEKRAPHPASREIFDLIWLHVHQLNGKCLDHAITGRYQQLVSKPTHTIKDLLAQLTGRRYGPPPPKMLPDCVPARPMRLSRRGQYPPAKIMGKTPLQPPPLPSTPPPPPPPLPPLPTPVPRWQYCSNS